MKMFVRVVAAATASFLVTTPVVSATTVIAQLGSAPLFGGTASLEDLRTRVSSYPERVAEAAGVLGLSQSEYRVFRAELARGEARAIVLPRYLESMAFYRNGSVQVLHDVEIPAQTLGWEIDVVEPGQTIRVLIPSVCGNMSILHEYHPAFAMKRYPSAVAASEEQSPAPKRPTAIPPRAPPAKPSPAHSPQSGRVPQKPAASPAFPPSAPPTAAPSPTPAAGSLASLPTPPTSPPAPSHHRFAWPILLPFILFFFHGGGSSSNTPAIPAPTCTPGCKCSP
jgi:hypothetical protein